MGWNDHVDDDGFSDFLQDLLTTELFDEKEARILELAIEEGERRLTKEQQGVLDTIVERNRIWECERCFGHIPWSEAIDALDNGGHCSWCEAMMSKDD